jgi:chorismate--pyruvate lyase
MLWTTRNTHRGRVRRWLGDSGSLSARLARAGQAFSVQVLKQGRQVLHADEAQALGLAGTRIGYVREVLLRVDGGAVVFARSVTAHAPSQGPWRAIRGLGNRPLADVLFRPVAGIARTPLEFARLRPASRLRRQVARAWQQGSGEPVAAGALPARRSVFRHRGAPLLVMEVFAAPHVPWCWPSRRLF